MPHDFSSHVLRRYFEATGWNEANSYLHLTSATAALLDFTIPPGVSLSFSASPAPTFFNTYRLRALPSLRGAFGYIFASIDPERIALDGSSPAQLDIGTSSAKVRFKDVIDRFKVHEVPRRPLGRDKVWKGGKRVDSRDYLLYGCIHVPSGRLDALYTTRLSETWQLLVTAVSSPPRLSSAVSSLVDFPNQHSAPQPHTPHYPQQYGQPQQHPGQGQDPNAATAAPAAAPDSGASSYGSGSVGPPGSTNLQFTLQQDTGRWCNEYSYSADDALWGFRVLHNFGWPGAAAQNQQQRADDAAQSFTGDDVLDAGLRIGGVGAQFADQQLLDSPTVGQVGIAGKAGQGQSQSGLKVVPAEDVAVGGGLRGRFSAGAEVFFSAVEKSAGLSTGIRFMTLPEGPVAQSDAQDLVPEARIPSQPPTIISATLNPMLGHLSTAYAARMSRNAVVGSRFDFNVYSYESEFTIGAEYWLRSQGPSSSSSNVNPDPEPEIRLERREPVLIAPPTTASLRDPSVPKPAPQESPKVEASLRTEPVPAGTSSAFSAIEGPTDSIALASAELVSSSAASSKLLPAADSITGVLKFRFSSSANVALLWEGRLRNCLVNLGVRADLTSRSAPIKSVGLDVLYFGTAGGAGPEGASAASSSSGAAAAAGARAASTPADFL
ncbi:hypothetical protein V8E36_005953 [Tilletia maclaganii]